MERLHQVMAGGGQKARLALVRPFGLRLGDKQVGRPLPNAAFQALVRFAQRGSRTAPFRHIGTGYDETTVGHWMGGDLKLRAVGATADQGLYVVQRHADLQKRRSADR